MCLTLDGLLLCCATDRLSALVCRNALLELSQDLITTSIRQDTPASLTGVWPLLSLFNHSCAPNAVAVTIGYQQPPQQQTLLQQPEQQQGQLGASQPPVNPWAVQQQGRKPDSRSSSSSSRRGGGGGNSSSSGGVARSGGGGEGGLTYCAAAGVGPFVLVRTVSDLVAGESDVGTTCVLARCGEGGRGVSQLHCAVHAALSWSVVCCVMLVA